MAITPQPTPLSGFDTFGDLIRYLRRRARLTQRELSIAVGYSEAQISRLETGYRPPDLATLTALFVPALHLEDDPERVAQLLVLACQARGEPVPERLSVTRTVGLEIAHEFGPSELAARPVQPGNLPRHMTNIIGYKISFPSS